jgi:hypothetical protein
VALIQAFGDAQNLFADIIDGQSVTAFGIGDAFSQTLGDARDFRPELF